jgi:hypothetical protein
VRISTLRRARRTRALACLLSWGGLTGSSAAEARPAAHAPDAAGEHRSDARPSVAHGSSVDPQHPGLRVDADAREVRIQAVAHPAAFRAALPPDHQYHLLVWEQGAAQGKSLFVTSVPDTAVARVFRELGADDGGGVPMAAWSLRWVPLVPQPDARVKGSPIDIRVAWEGRDAVPLADLLDDPGGAGVDMRFGGNEEHDAHWGSGCIVCLFSCPGGVISNAAYSIRDHQRGTTSFEPGALMPPEGTPVELVLTLSDLPPP